MDRCFGQKNIWTASDFFILPGLYEENYGLFNYSCNSMFISDKFSALWTQPIFNTNGYIFIISLPFLLHEKCPDFFLLTQRQQEAHPSVYDDVVPGDYSDSSCGIFSAKKPIFLHVFLLYIYHSRDSQFSYQRWPPRLSNHYFKTVLQKRVSRILTPPKLCEQNLQRENTKEISQTPSQLCNSKYLSDLCATA